MHSRAAVHLHTSRASSDHGNELNPSVWPPPVRQQHALDRQDVGAPEQTRDDDEERIEYVRHPGADALPEPEPSLRPTPTALVAVRNCSGPSSSTSAFISLDMPLRPYSASQSIVYLSERSLSRLYAACAVPRTTKAIITSM